MPLALLGHFLELCHQVLQALFLRLEPGTLFRDVEDSSFDLLKNVVELFEPGLYPIDIFLAALELVDLEVRFFDEILKRFQMLFHPLDFAAPF